MTSTTKNLPINPTDLLKTQLAEANARVGHSDAKRVKISIAGFTAPGGDTGKEITVAIIDYTLVHSFWHKAYDADVIIPPDCYANNRQFQELAPVKESPDPQSHNCAVCTKNMFKSAPNGKAKACRNSRLLAIVAADNIASAPMWTFSVAPTSTGRWDNYVRDLMKDNLTPMFALTKMTFEVVNNTYAKPIFSLAAPLSSGEVADAIARIEEARALIDLAPDWSEK